MPHILLIEDNPGDVRLIEELLAESNSVFGEYTTQHVDRVAAAVNVLCEPNCTVDAVLSDITLPDSSGMETLTTIAQAGSTVPVIFMTGTNNEDLAVEALKQGAQDYLIKGQYDGNRLAKALNYAMERHKFQRELSDVRAEVKASKQQAELLSQQKRQLLALTKAKDEFISLASHQLRTPATAVKQYLGMIVEGYVGDVPEELFKLIRTAYDSNDRQLEVINELLKTAQLDADNYHLNLVPTDLNDVVGDVITHLQPTFTMRRQLLEFDHADVPLASLDPGEMYLAIENVISNASKYSPLDTTIRVKTSAAHKKVMLSVTDAGVGIAKSDQKRIFDKFTRIDNELSDTVSGNGLGLYWVKRIIRLHKGTIKVTSEVGKGTTFTIGLPV